MSLWALTCCGPHPSSDQSLSSWHIHGWNSIPEFFLRLQAAQGTRPSAHLPAQIETRNLNACIKSFQRICCEQTDRLQRPSDTIRYLVLCVYNPGNNISPLIGQYRSRDLNTGLWLDKLCSTCFESEARDGNLHHPRQEIRVVTENLTDTKLSPLWDFIYILMNLLIMSLYICHLYFHINEPN